MSPPWHVGHVGCISQWNPGHISRVPLATRIPAALQHGCLPQSDREQGNQEGTIPCTDIIGPCSRAAAWGPRGHCALPSSDCCPNARQQDSLGGTKDRGTQRGRHLSAKEHGNKANDCPAFSMPIKHQKKSIWWNDTANTYPVIDEPALTEVQPTAEPLTARKPQSRKDSSSH